MTTTTASPLSPRALGHIGLAVVLGVLVLMNAGSRERVGVRELALPTVNADSLSKIEVGGKYKAVLEKSGQAWMVADPEAPEKKFPVEADAVDRVVDGLKALEAGAFVTGRSEKHDELELTEEKGTVLTVEDGAGKRLKVVLGRFAKGGGNYIRLQGSDDVYVGKGSLASAVRKNASQWRKKAIVSIEVDDLSELVVQAAGASPYTLVRGPSTAGEGDDAAATPGAWKLKEGTPLPADFRLDEEALSRLARAFATLRATDFFDEHKPDAELGFADPAQLSVVTGKGAAGAATTVRFGAEDDKKRRYVRIDGDQQVYLVSDYTRKNIAKSLDDLRDMTLLPGLDANNVASVTFDSPEGRVVLEKQADGFALTKGTPPADKPFDPNTVISKMTQLGRLKGATFVGKAQGFVPARPPLKITVSVEGETAPRSIEFGAELPAGDDGKASNQVYARTGDGFVYAVGKYQKGRWEKPYDLFKKVAPPPTPPGGGGGIPGMENLPPDIRKQLEAQLKAGNFPGGGQ